MAELKQILENIAKAIVDSPDDVVVTESVKDDNVCLELKVAPEDTGKVIGRHGRIAKSIRLVMKAAANVVDKKVTIDIR